MNKDESKQAHRRRRRLVCGKPRPQIPKALRGVCKQMAGRREKWLAANKPPNGFNPFDWSEDLPERKLHRLVYDVITNSSITPEPGTTWRGLSGTRIGGKAFRGATSFEAICHLLSKDELALKLRLKRRGIETLMARRKIPFIRIGHRIVRLSWPAVDKALEKFSVREV